MGVYIRGMEMPKGCAFCWIRKRNGKKIVCPFCDEEWDICDPMSADHRLDNCPLVPVPPHGRLIDADALAEYVCQQTDWLSESAIHAFCGILCKTPTIIEAEESET